MLPCPAAAVWAEPAPAGDCPGQKRPGRIPELLGPGGVSPGQFERDLAITPGGNERYFTVVGPGHPYSTITVVQREGSRRLGHEPAKLGTPVNSTAEEGPIVAAWQPEASVASRAPTAGMKEEAMACSCRSRWAMAWRGETPGKTAPATTKARRARGQVRDV